MKNEAINNKYISITNGEIRDSKLVNQNDFLDKL